MKIWSGGVLARIQKVYTPIPRSGAFPFSPPKTSPCLRSSSSCRAFQPRWRAALAAACHVHASSVFLTSLVFFTWRPGGHAWRRWFCSRLPILVSRAPLFLAEFAMWAELLVLQSSSPDNILGLLVRGYIFICLPR